MSADFDLDDLRRIVAGCRAYEPGHHLGRPFMSAYQIAIRSPARSYALLDNSWAMAPPGRW